MSPKANHMTQRGSALLSVSQLSLGTPPPPVAPPTKRCGLSLVTNH